MTTEILDIPLTDIDVPDDRARSLNPDVAAALAAVIAEQGQHHPIRVRKFLSRYWLVSGLHRLKAAEINGWDAIPATISSAETDEQARLEEVMENLARNELIALDRCHHLYELKVAWEQGGKSFSTSEDDSGQVFGFARSVAESVGMTKQAINMAVKIWTGLSPSSRNRLEGSDLARKQTELKALSEQSPTRQQKILDLIADDAHPAIVNVAQALFHIEEGVTPNAVERDFMKVRDGLAKLPEPTFDRLILDNEERIIAALKRNGRI